MWRSSGRDLGQIPASVVEDTSTASEITGLTGKASRDGKEFLLRLDRMNPFNGLYLRAQHERSLERGDASASFALEWEAFENGRGEAIRRLDKARLERLVQHAQLQHDMREKALHERLYRAQRMRNRVFALEYGWEAEALEKLLERRRREMAAGFATREDVAETGFKLERANARKAYHLMSEQQPVNVMDASLLQQAGTLKIQPAGILLVRAIEQSYEYKLQSLFARRSEFSHTWTDDLSLRVYLENRHDFGNASENILGVRLRLALDSDSGRNEVAELEKELYATQQLAVEARLRQKIEAATDTIREKQAALRIGEAEVDLLRERGRLACAMATRPVSVIDAAPARTMDVIQVLLREKSRDLLTLRFDILAQLLELAHLTQVERLTDLLAEAR